MRIQYGTGNNGVYRCTRCGRSGARCRDEKSRLVHKACLTARERTDYNKRLRASYSTADKEHGVSQ